MWKLLVVQYENNTSHSIITYCEAHIRNNESKHRWAGWACGNGSCLDKKAAHAFLASSLRGLTFSQLFMLQRLLSQTHTWERSTTWFLWVLRYTPTVSELQVCVVQMWINTEAERSLVYFCSPSALCRLSVWTYGVFKEYLHAFTPRASTSSNEHEGLTECFFWVSLECVRGIVMCRLFFTTQILQWMHHQGVFNS